MSSSGIVTHYIGQGGQSSNPQEIHHFKWKFYVQFVLLFQECIPGVK
jgi:hypothetical protein